MHQLRQANFRHSRTQGQAAMLRLPVMNKKLNMYVVAHIRIGQAAMPRLLVANQSQTAHVLHTQACAKSQAPQTVK
jgi:hypothetical protein